MRMLALLMAAIATLLATPAFAAGRVALVIGNAHYAQAVGPLANPIRDAELVAAALRRRGFAVATVSDARRVDLLAAVDRYARALAAAGPDAIGFLYYSGHGVANPDTRRNYVVPVDVASAADDRLWYESVPLDDLVGTITRTARGAVNLIVFDACRDQLALPRGRGLGGGKGLERIEAPESTLIAYSTAPGRTAADADATAATGPYATELAKALAEDGVDARQMFEEVKFGVLQRTGRKQQPWVEDGLAERVWIGAEPAPIAAAAVLSTPTLFGSSPPSDPQEAILWYKKAAASGDAEANNQVGWRYDNGIGVAQDYAQARSWYEKAVAAGSAAGMNNFAYLYGNGLGGEKDSARAELLYRRAASLGNASAMLNLGDLYETGSGVTQNYASALVWFQKASDAGNANAKDRIGWLYQNGLGVPRDYAIALRWYRLGAEAGSTAAMFDIGSLYETGNGVTKDVDEAVRWYRRAATEGNTRAKDALHRLGR